MVYAMESEVLIFTTAGEGEIAVADIAWHHHWLLCAVANCGQALRHIRMCRPQTVLVHIAGRSDMQATVTLVHQLHRRCRQLPLIAFTTQHDEQIERTIRAAGATCYCPQLPDLHLIQSVIQAAQSRAIGNRQVTGNRSTTARAHGPPVRNRAQPNSQRPP